MQLIVALYIKCAKSNFFLIENIDIQHKFTIFVYIILNPNRLMETRTVKTVRIFLASGAELSKDRVEFGNFINKLRVHYMSRGFDLVPIEWEYLENDDHTHRKQDEYNEQIKSCNIFVSLFYTTAGKYTIEEFEIALKENEKRKIPILTFMRELTNGEKAKKSLKDFKKKYFDEYYWGSYGNNDKLHLDFTLWLDKYLMSNSTFIVKNGIITLGDVPVAKMSEQTFVANNNDFQRMYQEIHNFPAEIEKLRKRTEKYPDEQEFRDDLKQAIDRYNALTKEFERYQQTLMDIAKFIADRRQEQTSEKLKRAIDTFESGDIQGANAILRELAIDANNHIERLDQERSIIHEDIEAFLLQAKTEMADVETYIEDRINRVAEIYAKADDWANRSAYNKKKYTILLYDFAKFLFDFGFYDKAEQIYLRQIAMTKELYGNMSIITAIAYNNIGVIYHLQRNETKELEAYLEALRIYKELLDTDIPETATAYNNIGMVLANRGYYDKALEFHFISLSIRKKILGDDHVETATSYNNIGAVYYSQHDFDNALKYLKKSLSIRKKHFELDHPIIADSYNNIGLAYYYQGDYNKAVKYLKKALAIFEKTLGPNHPNNVTVRNNISLIEKQRKPKR